MNADLTNSDGQRFLLAALVRFPDLFADRVELLQYRHFSGNVAMHVAKCVLDHFKQYRALPSEHPLRAAVHDLAKRKPDIAPELSLYLDKLFEEHVTEADARSCADSFFQSIRNAEVVQSLVRMADLLREGKIAEIGFKEVRNLEAAITSNERAAELEGKSVHDIASEEPAPEDVLLGPDDRYLCRGGSLLLSAPTGAGKSTLVMQLAAGWACGKEVCGIKPARPLRVVVIQAEDDYGDLFEMARGQFAAHEMTEEDWNVMHANTVFIAHDTSTGEEFLGFVRRVLKKHAPNLLVINPLNAYIGGNIDAERVAAFCRNGLNPLLHEYKCGLLLVHHTGKPRHDQKDDSTWKPGDFSYAYLGSSDLGNWARAIIYIRATAHPKVFEFIGAKRGDRLGWQTAGKSVVSCLYAHSEEQGQLVWVEPSADQMFDLQQAEEKRLGAARGGRKQVYTDERLLEPLADGAVLSVDDWLTALKEQACDISRRALYDRVPALERKKLIEKSAGRWKKVSGNTIKTSRAIAV